MTARMPHRTIIRARKLPSANLTFRRWLTVFHDEQEIYHVFGLSVD
jgi:hypothetical protein